jgi:hypothetical protein
MRLHAGAISNAQSMATLPKTPNKAVAKRNNRK